LRETAGQGITPLDGLEIQDLIHDAQTVFVYGWNFRAPDYVQRHAEKIRAYFRPIVEYEQASRQAVDRLRQSAEVVVGVHVRHGDYPTLKGGKFFFAISQYATWMHEMSDLFPGRKVSFLVCSDEPRNCHEFPGLTVGFGTGTPVGDLYSLAKCDYLLGPLSTFSQWASFYGEKPLLHFYDSNDRVELEKFRVSYLAEIP